MDSVEFEEKYNEEILEEYCHILKDFCIEQGLIPTELDEQDIYDLWSRAIEQRRLYHADEIMVTG